VPALPINMITKITAVAPADKASCPLWLHFLDEATGGDPELTRLLQQWFGYCLTGSTQEHALMFIHGDGGNGKSVFLNTVAGIMGDYAVTAPMDAFTISTGDRHPADLAMLRGARLVAASETEQGRSWAESRIKQLTGGDPISARFMCRDWFTFKPSFKLTIVGNHAPMLTSVDDAMRRRINIVPFTHKPAHPDPTLESKLRKERPSILRWAMAVSIGARTA
jgi:putative DNA primase/helicase